MFRRILLGFAYFLNDFILEREDKDQGWVLVYTSSEVSQGTPPPSISSWKLEGESQDIALHKGFYYMRPQVGQSPRFIVDNWQWIENVAMEKFLPWLCLTLIGTLQRTETPQIEDACRWRPLSMLAHRGSTRDTLQYTNDQRSSSTEFSSSCASANTFAATMSYIPW